jgi:uncharacterized protein (DUF488 family)
LTRRRLQILTIGYEGASLADFLTTLKAAGVQLLLDIRELPISRRKGFSKSALSAALVEAGIEYSHERALGSPREIRYRLREDGDLARFFSDFREYLATQRPLLDSLARTTTGAVALLCYERNHAECHRSVVADALARRAQSTVQHLTVPHPDGYQQTSHAARPHPRQSFPANE